MVLVPGMEGGRPPGRGARGPQGQQAQRQSAGGCVAHLLFCASIIVVVLQTVLLPHQLAWGRAVDAATAASWQQGGSTILASLDDPLSGRNKSAARDNDNFPSSLPDELQLPFTCPSVQLGDETRKRKPGAAAKCTGSIPNINKKDVNTLKVANEVPMLTPASRAYHTGTHAYHPRTRRPVLVVFGGCGDKSQQDKALGDTWTFDLVRRTWFLVKFDPRTPVPRARYAHAAAATCSGTEILMFGGFIPDGKLNDTCKYGASFQAAGTVCGETWILRPQIAPQRSWQRITTKQSPMARAGHSLTTSSAGAVLFGGVTAAAAPHSSVTYAPADPDRLSVLGDTWMFSCSERDWRPVGAPTGHGNASSPPARHSHSGVLLLLNTTAEGPFEEHIVIFGGTNSTTVPVSSHSTFFNDLWALHLRTETWTQLNPHGKRPQMRHSHSAVATAGNTLIIQGGTGVQGEHLRDFWEYDPLKNTWTRLLPWFYTPNSAYLEAARSSLDALGHRDIWGHVAIALDSDSVNADSYLAFGGFTAERFSAQTTKRLREYVRHLAPEDRNLVLWREAGNTGGPFRRTLAEAALWARPKEQSANTSSGLTCSQRLWKWGGVKYRGCAKPLGFDRFICPVDHWTETSAPRCWDRTSHPAPLHLPPPGTDEDPQPFYYDFCDETSVLLSGGVYNGDADHVGVIDSPGMVWVLTDAFWALDGIVYATEEKNLPQSRTEHTFTRVEGYQDPVSKELHPERFILFGGVYVSRTHSELLGDVHVFQPSLPGSVGDWTRLSPSIEGNVLLRRAGHAGASVSALRDPKNHRAGVRTTVFYFGGYAVQGWADEAPITYPDAFVQYDVEMNVFSRVHTLDDPEHDDSTNGTDNRPTPRWYHSLTGVYYPQPFLVLFGGQTGYERKNTTLLNDLWIFDVEERKWYAIPRAEDVPWPQQRSGHVAAAYGSKVIVFGGKRLIDDELFLSDGACALRNVDCGLCDLWELDLTTWVGNHSATPTWRLLSDAEDNCTTAASVRYAAGTMDGNFLNVIGGLHGRLSVPSSDVIFSSVGCTPGHFSHSYFDLPCQACARGTYAPETGHLCCLSCPSETSTIDEGSTDAGQCAACPPHYCKHGVCHFNNQTQRPQCSCSFIYLDDRCHIPWVVVFTVVGGLFLFAGPAFVTWYRRYKQRQERKEINAEQTRRELEEMHQSWMISIDELENLYLIGEGACSTVYRAEWHNMPVAVKKLRPALLELDPTGFTEDFAREVRVMRSVRHANIVTFYGAGREGKVPFLVTEFMARGSLQDLLQRQERRDPFSLDVKIRFALDAAKGMRFLHYHNPPWIHRDLKTANLLVNEAYTVKVADFGTSRLASLDRPHTTPSRRPSTNRRPPHKRRDTPGKGESERTPLLLGAGAINQSREDVGPARREPQPHWFAQQPHSTAGTTTTAAVETEPQPRRLLSPLPAVSSAASQERERALLRPSTQTSPYRVWESQSLNSSVEDDEEANEGEGAFDGAFASRGPVAASGRKFRSRHVHSESIAMTGNVGTPLYQAPEVISEEPYSVKADVYSFGLVLWEIYTGVPPFSDLPKLSLHALRMKVVEGVRPEIPPDCPEALAQLMQDCWSQRPTARPHFDKVVQHLLHISDMTSKLPRFPVIQQKRQKRKRKGHHRSLSGTVLFRHTTETRDNRSESITVVT